MNENKPFEHEIDPDLLAEIEEWEKADHDEPAEYYFSNPVATYSLYALISA